MQPPIRKSQSSWLMNNNESPRFIEFRSESRKSLKEVGDNLIYSFTYKKQLV